MQWIFIPTDLKQTTEIKVANISRAILDFLSNQLSFRHRLALYESPQRKIRNRRISTPSHFYEVHLWSTRGDHNIFVYTKTIIRTWILENSNMKAFSLISKRSWSTVCKANESAHTFRAARQLNMESTFVFIPGYSYNNKILSTYIEYLECSGDPTDHRIH